MIPQAKPPAFQVVRKGSPQAKHLWAAYNFTEGRGTTLYDSSGHGNHLTTSNGPVWSGQSLVFDGVDQDAQATGLASQTFHGASVDFYTDTAINSSSGIEVLLAWGAGNYLALGSSTASLTGEVITLVVTSADRTGVKNITIGVGWHNITIAHDAGLSRFRIFWNGLEQTTFNDGNTDVTTSAFTAIYIGQTGNDTGYADLTISGVRYYKGDVSVKGLGRDSYRRRSARLYEFPVRHVYDALSVPLGEVSVTGDMGILADFNAVATKEFNRGSSWGIRVQMEGSITKDFRNVQSLRGAIGIIAELDGVVSAQFTQEREGRIDIVAEFNSPVTFEKMKTGQIDSIVSLVASKSEGATPVTDQDIGEAIIFRAPKIDYVFRANKHPTGRKL